MLIHPWLAIKLLNASSHGFVKTISAQQSEILMIYILFVTVSIDTWGHIKWKIKTKRSLNTRQISCKVFIWAHFEKNGCFVLLPLQHFLMKIHFLKSFLIILELSFLYIPLEYFSFTYYKFNFNMQVSTGWNSSHVSCKQFIQRYYFPYSKALCAF